MYRGRFAPSPTGRLHFGSLVAAVASYLDARAHNGQWLVRIEDLDPPREQPGAAKDILNTLEAFALYWDEPVEYQSQRHKRYEERLDQLIEQQRVYACHCTRKQIRESGGVYQNICRNRQHSLKDSVALRFLQQQPITEFCDQLQGKVCFPQAQMAEDFIIKRKDGLFAYQLAVVSDDIDQEITSVVRGADLLDSTPRQIALYKCFQEKPPEYLHIPLAINPDGNKLSKQNYAPAIEAAQARSQLVAALAFLGQATADIPPKASCEEILTIAAYQWSRERVPRTRELPCPETT